MKPRAVALILKKGDERDRPLNGEAALEKAMEVRWRVDFTKNVAVSRAGAVRFHRRNDRTYEVLNIFVAEGQGVSKVQFSHDALRAIYCEAVRRRL